MSDSSESVPDLRASDADRERVAEVLRHATSTGQLTVDELEERLPSAYAARTRGDLDRLTSDLTVERLDSPAPAVAAPGGVTVREGPGGTRWVVSIMGGHDKRGRWRVAPHCTVVNIMGGSDVDLNDAELSSPVTRINMFSIMGGGEIRVPHGVDVQVSHFALMGGHGVRLGDEVPPPGAPAIHVRLFSIMGGSEVARGRRPTREQRRRHRELRKAGRHDADDG